MSYFTHAIANDFLTDFIADGPYYAGLYTTKADKDGAGGVEPTAPEYARQLVTLDTPAGSLTTNTAAVTYPTPVTSGGYGEIVAMGLFTALTGGTTVAVLDPPGGSFTMPVGYDRSFKIGYITLEFRES